MRLDYTESNPSLGGLYNMLPLQDSTVVVLHKKYNKYHVSRLSDRGDIIRNLITTDKVIIGLVLMSNNACLALHGDGSVHHQRRKENGEVLGSVYKVPNVGWLIDGIRNDDNQVLLVDYKQGEICLYNLTTRNKHVVMDKLKLPISVDKAVTDQGVFYIVSECGAHTIRVYNDRWMLVRSIERQGIIDGCLKYPHTARFLPDKTIMVSDFGNDRISCFTIEGNFIKQMVHVKSPRRLAVRYPSVWVAYGAYPSYNVKCFQIYQ